MSVSTPKALDVEPAQPPAQTGSPEYERLSPREKLDVGDPLCAYTHPDYFVIVLYKCLGFRSGASAVVVASR